MIKSVWKFVGRFLYALLWPILYIYLPFTKRTRILILHKDKALLVKVWLGNSKWYLPGGGLHRGENIAHGAIRELKEEIGLNVEPTQLQHLGFSRIKVRGLRFAYDQFVVQLKQKPELQTQKAEITMAEWVPINSLNSTNSTPAVIDTIAAWKQLSVSDTM